MKQETNASDKLNTVREDEMRWISINNCCDIYFCLYMISTSSYMSQKANLLIEVINRLGLGLFPAFDLQSFSVAYWLRNH